MLKRANRNKEKANAKNVLFVESIITDIALPDQTADCIISNGVINLVPEQERQLAFNEIFRLLKPGGRLAISDILAKKELPEKLQRDIPLYMGCISKLGSVECYKECLQKAGFHSRDCFPADNMSDKLLILSLLDRCLGHRQYVRFKYLRHDGERYKYSWLRSYD
jgi:arsenite methyltransferase